MKLDMSNKWYVRLVAQFKDGKVRIQMYDDGNVFKPGEYSQYGNVPATPARSLYISNYKIKPESFKKMHSVLGGVRGGYNVGFMYDQHTQWQQSVTDMVSSFEKGIKNNNLLAKKDDF
jgi:hypothetical protein